MGAIGGGRLKLYYLITELLLFVLYSTEDDFIIENLLLIILLISFKYTVSANIAAALYFPSRKQRYSHS